MGCSFVYIRHYSTAGCTWELDDCGGVWEWRVVCLVVIVVVSRKWGSVWLFVAYCSLLFYCCYLSACIRITTHNNKRMNQPPTTLSLAQIYIYQVTATHGTSFINSHTIFTFALPFARRQRTRPKSALDINTTTTEELFASIHPMPLFMLQKCIKGNTASSWLTLQHCVAANCCWYKVGIKSKYS